LLSKESQVIAFWYIFFSFCLCAILEGSTDEKDSFFLHPVSIDKGRRHVLRAKKWVHMSMAYSARINVKRG
jgi:hypothetical protein